MNPHHDLYIAAFLLMVALIGLAYVFGKDDN